MENSLHKYLQFIEVSVKEITFPPKPASLYQPMSYILNLGGKRVRPVLTLIACDVFGTDFQKAKNAALAIELFHNFSLIHDDIMDNAPLRRGKPTVHQKWNQSIAILSGDGMIIEAYKLLHNYFPETSHTLTGVFNKTALEVCEGQQLDMDFETLSQVSISDYLEMIRLKTAVLLGCSLQMGAIVGGASQENQEDIYAFGMNLGIAFQLQDDILDLYADQAKFGKQVGGDVLSNKKTYLLLKAFEDANPDQEEMLIKMASEKNPEQKIALAKTAFAELNIREKAESKMNDYYQLALKNLAHLKVDSSQKKPLQDLAEFLMSRQN
jgi:geranylgeranyl diphosphate synthase type II